MLHSVAILSLLGRSAISWFESRSPDTFHTCFLSLLFGCIHLNNKKKKKKKQPGGRPVGATSYRQQGEYGAQSY